MPTGEQHDDPNELELDAAFEREAALLRSLGAGDVELVEAPDAVWAGIEAALADDARTDDDRIDGPRTPAIDRPTVHPEAPVVSFEARRRRPRRSPFPVRPGGAAGVSGCPAPSADPSPSLSSSHPRTASSWRW